VSGPTPEAEPLPLAAAAPADGWHRLHPLSPLVRAGRQFAALLVLLAGLAVASHKQAGSEIVTDVAIIGVALVGGLISWLVTRWQVADGVLRVDTGLIRRESRRFPLSQIQAVDVVQTGLARVLGLAELHLRVAGGDASRGGRLASLRLADAEELRRLLLARSAGQANDAGARGSVVPAQRADVSEAEPARQLFRVRSGRLAFAIVASRTGAIALIVIAGVTAIAVSIGLRAVGAYFLPGAIGAVLAVWRQFNGEYGTTVATGPDGLRLHTGLVQTTAETIRPGRVQAVRLVEPLIWRAFGWCRLEVDVAGPRSRRENQSEAQRLRALIPVGSRAEAARMLGELLSSQPQPDRRAPRQARLKAPLLYHFLAWGGDERYVVASHGRICRKTTWVPLEKVQSIRWEQGPLQRRLGLASIRLDVAGKRVTGAIEDRSAAEAHDLLMRLPDLARDARARER
jgi:putative membrane protein